MVNTQLLGLPKQLSSGASSNLVSVTTINFFGFLRLRFSSMLGTLLRSLPQVRLGTGSVGLDSLTTGIHVAGLFHHIRARPGYNLQLSYTHTL